MNEYAEGYEAFLAGRSADTNPYDPTSDQFLDWDAGWGMAAFDAEGEGDTLD